MARFPTELVERIKREVALERLAEAGGIALKRKGQDLVGLCPFHEETEPSLHITPATNLFHCFGCDAAGSCIDWVMRRNGVSFRHAVELLREDVGAAAAGAGRPLVRSTVRRLPPPVDPDAGDQELLRQVVRFYHETLKESPDEGLAYLASRGLDSSEMVDHFQLGFANRTLGYRLPEKNRQAGEELRNRLQKVGVLRASGHEHFAGSLVVPVFDESGKVAELYGRKVTSNLRKGTPLHLYLPGPHRGVWNVAALAAANEVILCEALLDALTFWRHGFRNVTASYGAGGLTEEHVDAFRRHGTEVVLIAYDRDEAGDRGAEAVAEKLVALGITCSRVQFPHGMDANEYARKVTPAPRALEVLLAGATWMGGPTRPRARVFAASLLAAAAERKTEPSPAEPAIAPASPAAEVSPERSPMANRREDPGLPEAKTASPAATELPISAASAEEDELVVRLEDRTYRVRGLPEVLSFERLLVNVFVSREGELAVAGNLAAGFHVERFDLYNRRDRTAFAKEAAPELRLPEERIKKDLGQVLLHTEQLLEARRKRPPEETTAPPAVAEPERAEALSLLRDPHLLDRILADFARAGVVGEETNKLVGYLAAVSRKLPDPLAVIVQSASAAGKSSLMEAVLAFVPPEDRVKYSAMTGQSLFYIGARNLKHKVLAIVEEEGAERATYALKLLQSEGELTIASTGKDPQTGKLVTQDYHVEGPVMIFLTTTASEVEEELLNRCLVLTVDEDRDQTRAIHRLQRERQTLEGLLARRDRERIWTLHRNAQRLLRPLLVVNPFARELTFLDDRTRTRRDHLKYLTLIQALAFLHQHQREVKTAESEGGPVEYIEVTLEDLAVANRLAHEVLGRSLDELAPQTRRLLLRLEEMVEELARRRRVKRADVRFSRREVREYTGWGQTQLKVHLARLVELEYLALHQGGRGLGYLYELLFDGRGQDGRPVLCGLLDVERLRSHGYDGNRSGPEGGWSGGGRPPVGVWSGGGRAANNGASPHGDARIEVEAPVTLENAHLDRSHGESEP